MTPLSRHPLLAFVALAYGLTWLFTGPFVYLWREVYGREFQPWMYAFLPGVLGPTIAAILVTAARDGRPGVARLLGKCLVWRVHVGWWLFALLVPFAVAVAAVTLSNYRTEAMAAFAIQPALSALPAALLFALPFGPLPEELGWRGFALPRLQRRFSPLVSSLILGVIWAGWHLPMFWFPGAAIPSFLDVTPVAVLLYVAEITAASLLLTTLCNNTRGSVLLAVLLHLTFNVGADVVLTAFAREPTLDDKHELYYLRVLLFWVVALTAHWLFPGHPVVADEPAAPQAPAAEPAPPTP